MLMMMMQCLSDKLMPCHKRHKLYIYWNAERHEINLNATWILQSNLASVAAAHNLSRVPFLDGKMQQKLIKIYLFLFYFSLTLAHASVVIDKRFIIQSCAWQFMQFSRLDFFIKLFHLLMLRDFCSASLQLFLFFFAFLEWIYS